MNSTAFLTWLNVSRAQHSSRAAWGMGVVAVAAAGLFVALVRQVNDHQGLARSDPRVLNDIISVRNGVLTSAAKDVTNLGTAVAYLLLAGAGYWYWRQKRSFALPVATLLWMASGLLLRLEISRAVGRPRPPQTWRLVGTNGFSFPSGHTATATIGFGLIVLLLWQVVPSHRLLIAAVAIIAAVAVGASRSYLGVHWLTDVLGGWAFGTAWVALGGLITELTMPRKS